MENEDHMQTVSICSELNLNVDQLKIQQLLQKPIYRRLYNIVQNDKNRSKYSYRKNLIKQLYFLLKITSIMKPQLREVYLQKIEKWYNLNDHKKTQLGEGGFKNLFKYLNKQKQPISKMRPQSGVQWNKNVHPFLRPYTATKPTHYKNNLTRPESHKSKFGQSTVASTQLQSYEQIAIKDFNLSIEEEWQASQSFINKNRTMHHESQPIYEQLINLIKKAHDHVQNDTDEDNKNQIIYKMEKKNNFSSKIQEKSKTNLEKLDVSIKEQMKLQQNKQKDEAGIEDKVQQQSQHSDDDSEALESTVERKIYINDRKMGQKQRRSIDQFQFYKANDKKDQILLKKINTKYLNFTNQKIVNYSKTDNELIRHYVNFTRFKSSMKRQFNRKSQSKRLLSAKINSSTSLNSSKKPEQRIYSAFPKKILKQTENISNNFFDFSNQITNKENHVEFVSSGKYNQSKELDQIYKRSIDKFKKFNKNTLSVAEIKCTDHAHLLTKYDSFLSRDKINPISDAHIERINSDTLQEIERIKQRVAGMGKKSISTDSLVKALYLNAYDDIQSSNTIGFGNNQASQQVNKEFDWRNRNIYYNMLSDGTKKKLKKKSRKLKKKVV